LSLVSYSEAGFFECGVCQSLLHFWSNARVDSTFDQVCDAFPNYVNMFPNYKTGQVQPVQEPDAPKDKVHGLPVTHMERCRRVMDTLLLRLSEEGIVQVKDSTDAQVYAPTTWENPAILEILCPYVYPKLGAGYCKGEFGGSVDDKCRACINYVHLAKLSGVNNPSCAARPTAEQELCQFVEARVSSLPTGGDTITGTIKAIDRARDLDLLEGRFLACRDFLDICNEKIDDSNERLTYKKLQQQYTQAYDPYWAMRNYYNMQGGARALAQVALGTKSSTTAAAGAATTATTSAANTASASASTTDAESNAEEATMSDDIAPAAEAEKSAEKSAEKDF